jgi:hypothetical protein
MTCKDSVELTQRRGEPSFAHLVGRQALAAFTTRRQSLPPYKKKQLQCSWILPHRKVISL